MIVYIDLVLFWNYIFLGHRENVHGNVGILGNMEKLYAMFGYKVFLKF